jgi:tRNA-dihydrouridine synthase
MSGKKVNKKLAGSALLRQPDLVRSICRAVVDAVSTCHLEDPHRMGSG